VAIAVAGEDTFGTLLDKYQRRVRLCVTVGAALGTLAALLVGVLAGGYLEHVPAILKALFLTGFVATGACLSKAYIGFEWAGTQMNRSLSQAANDDAKRKLEASTRPGFPGDARSANRWWRGTQVAFILTVAIFMVAIWWPVFAKVSVAPNVIHVTVQDTGPPRLPRWAGQELHDIDVATGAIKTDLDRQRRTLHKTLVIDRAIDRDLRSVLRVLRALLRDGP
jgi:hypothetical protein